MVASNTRDLGSNLVIGNFYLLYWKRLKEAANGPSEKYDWAGWIHGPLVPEPAKNNNFKLREFYAIS